MENQPDATPFASELLKTTVTVAQTLRLAFLQLFSPIAFTRAQLGPYLGSLP